MGSPWRRHLSDHNSSLGIESVSGRWPLSFFDSRPIFRAGKTPKIPFLGLSLLTNPTETLATQAINLLNGYKYEYYAICTSEPQNQNNSNFKQYIC